MQALWDATARQLQTEAKVKKLEEVKLERDVQLTQADNKNILGQQLEQTSEQLQDLACLFARVRG